MHKHNLRLYKAATPRRKEIKALKAKGWSLNQLAKKFDISPQRVAQICKQEEYDGR